MKPKNFMIKFFALGVILIFMGVCLGANYIYFETKFTNTAGKPLEMVDTLWFMKSSSSSQAQEMASYKKNILPSSIKPGESITSRCVIPDSSSLKGPISVYTSWTYKIEGKSYTIRSQDSDVERFDTQGISEGISSAAKSVTDSVAGGLGNLGDLVNAALGKSKCDKNPEVCTKFSGDNFCFLSDSRYNSLNADDMISELSKNKDSKLIGIPSDYESRIRAGCLPKSLDGYFDTMEVKSVDGTCGMECQLNPLQKATCGLDETCQSCGVLFNCCQFDKGCCSNQCGGVCGNQNCGMSSKCVSDSSRCECRYDDKCASDNAKVSLKLSAYEDNGDDLADNDGGIWAYVDNGYVDDRSTKIYCDSCEIDWADGKKESPDPPTKVIFHAYTQSGEYDVTYSCRCLSEEKSTHLKMDILFIGPIYEPEEWTNQNKIQSNNCYSYSVAIESARKSLPGAAHNKAVSFPPNPDKNLADPARNRRLCEEYIQASEADGLVYMGTDTYRCMGSSHAVALVMDLTGNGPYDRDFHWYRRDNTGYWSHKYGGGPVTSLDTNGKLIKDPKLAARAFGTIKADGKFYGNLHDSFCGYFCVDESKVYISGD